MKTFSVKEAVKRGWEIWKGNKKVLTLAAAFTMVLGAIPNFADGVLGAVFEIVIFLVSIFVTIGWMKMLLAVEKGEKVVFEDLFRYGHLFWKYLWATILLGLVVIVGFILFIIPGIYLALKYMFVLYLIADKELSVGDAFKESAQMTKGVKWKLFGFWWVCAGAFLLGLIVFFVGIFIAMPVVGLATVVIYRRLLEEALQPSEVVPQNVA